MSLRLGQYINVVHRRSCSFAALSMSCSSSVSTCSPSPRPLSLLPCFNPRLGARLATRPSPLQRGTPALGVQAPLSWLVRTRLTASGPGLLPGSPSQSWRSSSSSTLCSWSRPASGWLKVTWPAGRLCGRPRTIKARPCQAQVVIPDVSFFRVNRRVSRFNAFELASSPDASGRPDGGLC